MSLSRLYAVLDTGMAVGRGWTVADLGQAFLDGGAQLIQLRAKHLDARALLDAADRLVRLAEPAGARIIVNDRADVAAMCGAAGVHVGQEDLAPRIAVGPIYGTTTTDTGYTAVGLDLVRHAAKAGDTRPIVAIGGITLARAAEVLAAGAASVAVISDLLGTGDPTRRVAEFLAQLSGSG